MKFIEEIAQILFDAGVRLENEHECLAMAEADKNTRFKIVTAYRNFCNQDIEVTINLNTLGDYDHNMWHMVYESIYEDLKSKYSEVDEALWLLQQKDVAGSHEDDMVVRYKDRMFDSVFDKIFGVER